MKKVMLKFLKRTNHLKGFFANTAHNHSTNFSSHFVPKPCYVSKSQYARKSVFVKPSSGKSESGSRTTVFDLEKSSFYKNKTLRQSYKCIKKEKLYFGCLQNGQI